MAKDPAFLFYPNDWDGGTKLFTRAQKGAYIDLLMCQFHNGHMTSHDIGHVLGQIDFDAMWENKLKTKFKQDSEGKFFNEKLENEQLKRKNWCESRRNNKEGKNQFTGHMTTHTTGHMVNVNVNVNDNVLLKQQTNTFEQCWAEYPRRIGKKAAFKHYCASVKTKEDAEACLMAVRNYLDELEQNKTEEKFIKHGSTFFNNWRDYAFNEESSVI